MGRKANQFFDVKVVYLLQTSQVAGVKTLFLGSWPLNSIGSNKQLSTNGDITLRFHYPCKVYYLGLRELLKTGSSKVRIPEVMYIKGLTHV